MNDEVRVGMERYLDGAMPSEEVSVFLASIQQDPEALAFLGHALEDQAHLFDVIRAAAPEKRRGDTTRRLRSRRRPVRLNSSRGMNAFWFAGVAAAGLFALLIALSESGTRKRLPPPVPVQEVAATPTAPAPQPVPIPAPIVPEPPRTAPVAPPPAKIETPAPPPPAPVPLPETPRPDPPPVREPLKPTLVAVAVLDRVQGDAFVLRPEGKIAAKSGVSLLSGQGLQSAGGAVLKFPDKTQVELGASTTLRDCSQGPGGKRLQLDSGTLVADVAKQGAATPFVIATAQAEVVVIGTRFSVVAAADATRVEVREGRVRVARLSDGATVEVPAEHTALVSAGTALEAKPFPIDEILLTPAKGTLVGGDWRAVKDAESLIGMALEAPRAQKGALQDAPCVSFTVAVDAGKPYSVWVRGKCLAKSSRIEHDAVILEFSDSEATEPTGPNKGQAGSPERALFNGFMHHSGYGWVGSDADQGREVAPVTVRFARSGRQTIRLYAWESPMRIDAIWLSSTQKTRPDDAQTGPVPPKK